MIKVYVGLDTLLNTSRGEKVAYVLAMDDDQLRAMFLYDGRSEEEKVGPNRLSRIPIICLGCRDSLDSEFTEMVYLHGGPELEVAQHYEYMAWKNFYGEKRLVLELYRWTDIEHRPQQRNNRIMRKLCAAPNGKSFVYSRGKRRYLLPDKEDGLLAFIYDIG